MANREATEQYVKLEARIIELGGKMPKPWPWATDQAIRNLQLIETVEWLEGRGPKPVGADNVYQ